jgi:hypothetical protein
VKFDSAALIEHDPKGLAVPPSIPYPGTDTHADHVPLKLRCPMIVNIAFPMGMDVSRASWQLMNPMPSDWNSSVPTRDV